MGKQFLSCKEKENRYNVPVFTFKVPSLCRIRKKNALDIKAFVLHNVSYYEKKSPGHEEETHRIYVLLEDWEESKGFWYLRGCGSVTESRVCYNINAELALMFHSSLI